MDAPRLRSCQQGGRGSLSRSPATKQRTKDGTTSTKWCVRPLCWPAECTGRRCHGARFSTSLKALSLPAVSRSNPSKGKTGALRQLRGPSSRRPEVKLLHLVRPIIAAIPGQRPQRASLRSSGRGSSSGAVPSGRVTTKLPRSRISSDDAPIITVKRPGSTVQ